MRLILVRHAETLANAEGRIQGQIPPPAFGLSPEGKEQAERLRERFEKEELRPTQVYSSPLRRTKETAEILARSWSAAVAYWDDLMEHNIGILEGLTIDEARQRYPEIDLEQERARGFAGVQGAESLADRWTRGRRVVEAVLGQHGNEDVIVMVSHGGILQYIVSAILGSPRPWQLEAANTALFDFEVDAEGYGQDGNALLDSSLWRINRFNDASHLS